MSEDSRVNARPLQLMFGGDVMLGRLVGEAILRHGADYPLGPVAPLMQSADLTIVNLECAITDSARQWQGAPKAFYFGAPPQATQALTHAGIDMVSLANNHVLDFEVAGLHDTLRHLQRHAIGYAGAGENLAAAHRACRIERGGLRLAMAAFCDHQADFAAAGHRPGIAYLDLADEKAASAAFEAALAPLRHTVDWPVLSLHWGPSMVTRPSPAFRRIAHAAIDSGWKILFGHSAHVFHGVEMRNGCPILYAAGDLVDDYAVDPAFRNDLQLLFGIEIAGDSVRRIRLHPLRIADCRVGPAHGADAAHIAERMAHACAALGTRVQREGNMLWIDGDAS